MANFMNFSANVKNAFDNNVEEYRNFSKLLIDAANDTLVAYSAEEANTAIVNKFNEVLGINENSSKRDIRYAIKENQVAIFKLIEETLEDLLVTGWQNDPFFKEYVDVRNLALGDKNEFYTPDDSILSVYKVSGNHHDICLRTSVRTK